MESVKAESEKLPETSEEVRQQEKCGSALSSMLFVKEELNGGPILVFLLAQIFLIIYFKPRFNTQMQQIILS